LIRRNALKLSHDRFRTESELLASTVGQVLEKAEAKRREQEERERLETERRETEERERREAERRQKEGQEQLEAERRQREERERINEDREHEEKEGLESEHREKERLEAERREKQRLETERREKERPDAESEKQRLAAEQREQEGLESEARQHSGTDLQNGERTAKERPDRDRSLAGRGAKNQTTPTSSKFTREVAAVRLVSVLYFFLCIFFVGIGIYIGFVSKWPDNWAWILAPIAVGLIFGLVGGWLWNSTVQKR
jgi:hypothetical protein